MEHRLKRDYVRFAEMSFETQIYPVNPIFAALYESALKNLDMLYAIGSVGKDVLFVGRGNSALVEKSLVRSGNGHYAIMRPREPYLSLVRK